MKIFFLSMIFFLLISCDRKEKSTSGNKKIEEALNFFIEEIVSEKFNNEFVVFHKFTCRLGDTLLNYALKSIDTTLSKKDITYIKNQRNSLQGKYIDQFLQKKFHKFLTKKKYAPSDTIKLYFLIGAPLFSLDEDFFILYSIQIFEKQSETKWGSMFFIFRKRESEWILEGLLEEIPEYVKVPSTEANL